MFFCQRCHVHLQVLWGEHWNCQRRNGKWACRAEKSGTSCVWFLYPTLRESSHQDPCGFGTRHDTKGINGWWVEEPREDIESRKVAAEPHSTTKSLTFWVGIKQSCVSSSYFCVLRYCNKLFLAVNIWLWRSLWLSISFYTCLFRTQKYRYISTWLFWLHDEPARPSDSLLGVCSSWLWVWDQNHLFVSFSFGSWLRCPQVCGLPLATCWWDLGCFGSSLAVGLGGGRGKPWWEGCCWPTVALGIQPFWIQ